MYSKHESLKYIQRAKIEGVGVHNWIVLRLHNRWFWWRAIRVPF